MSVALRNTNAPATSKQLWRIRKDAVQLDVAQLPARLQEKLEVPEKLSRLQASELIDAMSKLPLKQAVEQLPDGRFVPVSGDEVLEVGAYAVNPWDCDGCLIRVWDSRRTGRRMVSKVKLDWKTGSRLEASLGTVKALLEGETELGPVRPPRELPLEEIVAFIDLSGWCIACGMKAADTRCTHV